MKKQSYNNHSILVFDSGVGGLSIVERIRENIPGATITYLADNALFPYGLLEEELLIDRVTQVVSDVCQQYQIDIVVIGCNSASTLALPHLRKNLAIPVVGVVPAIKPAAKLSNNKVIGLLATPGTVNRDYTNNLISDFANECKVIRVGSSELVQLIEQKFRGVPPPNKTFKEILTPLHESIQLDNLDTVILACTHFPLALKELSQAAPDIIYWIDSGVAIAKQVHRLLAPIPKSPPTPQNIALFTNMNNVNNHLKSILKRYGFHIVQRWISPTL